MMRKLFTILIAVLSIQFSATVSALEDCPTNVNVMWTDCVGTYNYPDGEQYSGEFKDDKRHGQGTYTSANGSQYIGESKDNKFHGQGTFTTAKGDQYIGEFKDDKMHGQGTYTSIDGSQYIGEFKDDKKHGLGTYTYSDGTSETGIWRNNELISDVCKNMGLSPNTEAYGMCILKLMD